MRTSSKARVRTIPNTQALHDSNNSKRRGSGLVATLVVRCSSASEQADEERGNGLVVDVEDACLCPFIVQYAFVRSQKDSRTSRFGLTHDGEEDAALIPTCFHGATESSGEGAN